jgi:hypothetical protein
VNNIHNKSATNLLQHQQSNLSPHHPYRQLQDASYYQYQGQKEEIEKQQSFKQNLSHRQTSFPSNTNSNTNTIQESQQSLPHVSPQLHLYPRSTASTSSTHLNHSHSTSSHNPNTNNHNNHHPHSKQVLFKSPSSPMDELFAAVSTNDIGHYQRTTVSDLTNDSSFHHLPHLLQPQPQLQNKSHTSSSSGKTVSSLAQNATIISQLTSSLSPVMTKQSSSSSSPAIAISSSTNTSPQVSSVPVATQLTPVIQVSSFRNALKSASQYTANTVATHQRPHTATNSYHLPNVTKNQLHLSKNNSMSNNTFNAAGHNKQQMQQQKQQQYF